MRPPLLILGAPWAGSAAVVSLLSNGAGATVIDPEPPSATHPTGSGESLRVVRAHRELLRSLDADLTTPPARVDAAALDVTALRSIISDLKSGDGCIVKEPALVPLLPAWRAAGLEHAHLIAVVRNPIENAMSIADHVGIPMADAERIVDHYLESLVAISSACPVHMVPFGPESSTVIDAVRAVAESIGLTWDTERAEASFLPELLGKRADHADTSPAWERLDSIRPRTGEPPSTPAALPTTTNPADGLVPLRVHLGDRYVATRRALWDVARRVLAPELDAVELIVRSARHVNPPTGAFRSVTIVEVDAATGAADAILAADTYPMAVIAPGIVSGLDEVSLTHLFQSLAAVSPLFVELVIDVPAPTGSVTARLSPPPQNRPTPSDVLRLAEQNGWHEVSTERVSPGSIAVHLRRVGEPPAPEYERAIATERQLRALRSRIFELEGRLEKSEAAARAAKAAANHSTTNRLLVVRRRLRHLPVLAAAVGRWRRWRASRR